jgi:hypothetical protein
VKNVLLVVCLVTIPFAFARAAVRLVVADNGACHSCSGAFTEVGSSGGPEMVCTTNNCRSGCKVQYEFWEYYDEEFDEFIPIESWSCNCTSSPSDPHCELAVEREFIPGGPPEYAQYCQGECLQRGTCEGTHCTPEGTYWRVCNCNSH